MGVIKGQTNYKRWKSGGELTRQESIEANCYVCNGGENGYCGGEQSCILYRYSPFTRKAMRKRREKAQNSPARDILAPASNGQGEISADEQIS